MFNPSKFIALCAAFSFSTAAFADTGIATLSNPTGKVLVNQGKGFMPAQASVELNAGDRIMVGGESTAQVDYTLAHCQITVNAMSVLVISAKPVCKTGEAVAQLQSTMIEPVGLTNHNETFSDFGAVATGLGVAGAVGLGIAVAAGVFKSKSVSAP